MAARSIPSLARRERERAATRQKILDAARRMLVQHGYEGTTMRAIAAKIGYTPTAIYHYFKDKDALVAELSANDYRAFSQALQRTGTAGDPVDRLGKIGAAYVEFGLTHPMQYQFLFMTRRPRAPRAACRGIPTRRPTGSCAKPAPRPLRQGDCAPSSPIPTSSPKWPGAPSTGLSHCEWLRVTTGPFRGGMCARFARSLVACCGGVWRGGARGNCFCWRCKP